MNPQNNFLFARPVSTWLVFSFDKVDFVYQEQFFGWLFSKKNTLPLDPMDTFLSSKTQGVHRKQHTHCRTRRCGHHTNGEALPGDQQRRIRSNSADPGKILPRQGVWDKAFWTLTYWTKCLIVTLFVNLSLGAVLAKLRGTWSVAKHCGKLWSHFPPIILSRIFGARIEDVLKPILCSFWNTIVEVCSDNSSECREFFCPLPQSAPGIYPCLSIKSRCAHDPHCEWWAGKKLSARPDAHFFLNCSVLIKCPSFFLNYWTIINENTRVFSACFLLVPPSACLCSISRCLCFCKMGSRALMAPFWSRKGALFTTMTLLKPLEPSGAFASSHNCLWDTIARISPGFVLLCSIFFIWHSPLSPNLAGEIGEISSKFPEAPCFPPRFP